MERGIPGNARHWSCVSVPIAAELPAQPPPPCQGTGKGLDLRQQQQQERSWDEGEAEPAGVICWDGGLVEGEDQPSAPVISLTGMEQ